MSKERFTFFITRRNKVLLQKASQCQGNKSMGAIVNALIEQKLADPLKVLEARRKEYVDMVHVINNQIEKLQKIEEEGDDGSGK